MARNIANTLKATFQVANNVGAQMLCNHEHGCGKTYYTCKIPKRIEMICLNFEAPIIPCVFY